MMLSGEPVDGFFSRLAKVYLIDKTKTWFGFQGHRRFSLNTVS